MKNTTALLTLSTALCACTGCNQHDDSAKFEALSQQLNQIQQNEVVLGQRIDIISAKVDALPAISQLNSEGYFYYTNELNNIDLRAASLSQQMVMIGNMQDIIFTNVERIYAGQFDLQKTAWDIKDDTRFTFGLVTNSLLLDTGYTRLKVDDIGLQIATVKARLGITY